MSIANSSPSAEAVQASSAAGAPVKASFVRSLQKVVQENIRDYGMYIALFVIIEIFTVTTNGLFISSRNIVNLINQSGFIVVLAVGMTLVIIIHHIDLSVGFLSGFIGAIAAVALKYW